MKLKLAFTTFLIASCLLTVPIVYADLEAGNDLAMTNEYPTEPTETVAPADEEYSAIPEPSPELPDSYDLSDDSTYEE